MVRDSFEDLEVNDETIKTFSSVQFSSLLFSQNTIQYKSTYRNCKVAREPRRNQKAL